MSLTITVEGMWTCIGVGIICLTALTFAVLKYRNK